MAAGLALVVLGAWVVVQVVAGHALDRLGVIS